MSYASQLWSKEKGHQLPMLLADSPSYIMEDIKAAAYGHHLFEVSDVFIHNVIDYYLFVLV